MKYLGYIKKLAKKSRIIRSVYEKMFRRKKTTILDDKTFLENEVPLQEVDK